MRQRRIKDLEEKTALHSDLIVKEPTALKGTWQQWFAENKASSCQCQDGRAAEDERGGEQAEKEIYLEIGCGKGRFITTLAEQNPDKLYIAVEGAESVVLRALEKAKEKGLSNIAFITQYVNDLTEFFEPGELKGMYLNFSDPWPKDRHAKRRLTHSRFLQNYKQVLLPGSFIEFKTDNDGLFAFSVPEFEANGLRVVERTDDLHKTEYPSRLVGPSTSTSSGFWETGFTTAR